MPPVRRVGPTARRQTGLVLFAVLIVILLASMVALSLMFHLRAEETAAAASSGSEQAWAAAMSGMDEAIRLAASTPRWAVEWEDNSAALQEQLVLDDGADRWYFSVYSMGDRENGGIRFGLTDEASKLNVNTATEAALGKLPRMTPYLVQGLLDFLDTDNTPRPEGAEQEYYDTLPRPYAAANRQLLTLEEMLLVRGFTPSLLFGEDANLNFQLDPNEDDAEALPPPDNKDGRLDCGLRPLLTISSADLNKDDEGLLRTDLNDAQHAFPEKDFSPATVAYIAALRRNKAKITHAADLLEAKGKFKDEKGQEVELESGVGKQELAAVLNRFTTTSQERLPGLINVNTASAAVLQTLPDVDEALADSIVAARKHLRPEQRRTAAWLYEESLVDAARFKKLAPLLTARGWQFHFHVVGYGIPSGRYRVIEALVDLTGPQPTISYLRDITRLGLPFKIETAREDAPEAGHRGSKAAAITPRLAPSHKPKSPATNCFLSHRLVSKSGYSNPEPV